MAHILISYRRQDSDVFAGRIRDKIADKFGADSVFMDIDNIPFGRDFRTHIRDALGTSDVVIVVIGNRWLGGAKKSGLARILDETDPVRIEVETALQKGIPVIPVLAGDARMPEPAQLPETLKDFAFINAATVDTGRDFHPHMDRVLRSIEAIIDGRPDEPPTPAVAAKPMVAAKPAPIQKRAFWPPSRTAWMALGAAVVVLGGAAALWAPDAMEFWNNRPAWCRYAAYEVEKAICAERTFFGRDRRLNEKYALLLRTKPENAATLRKEQAEWLAKRNLCTGSDRDCIYRAYDMRLAELDSQLRAAGN